MNTSISAEKLRANLQYELCLVWQTCSMLHAMDRLGEQDRKVWLAVEAHPLVQEILQSK